MTKIVMENIIFRSLLNMPLVGRVDLGKEQGRKGDVTDENVGERVQSEHMHACFLSFT